MIALGARGLLALMVFVVLASETIAQRAKRSIGFNFLNFGQESQQHPFAKDGKQLSTVEIIERSGFKYEIYNCTSLDGYVTQLVRIVNPYVAREHLRRVPVILYTGQGTSPAAFLAASLGSHGPAHWAPETTHLARDHDHNHNHENHENHDDTYAHTHDWRKHHLDDSWPMHHDGEHKHYDDDDGHNQQHHKHLHHNHLRHVDILASNRSLAAVLSNCGYDVWLVPTRGVDSENRNRVEVASSKSGIKRLLENKQTLLKNTLPVKPAGSSKQDIEESLPLINRIRDFAKSLATRDYWSFSSDEIVEFELKLQLEKIRWCTKSEKLSLITYSNGGFLTFAFLAAYPGYALKHLDVVINLAPAVYVNRFNLAYALSGALSHLTPQSKPYPEDKMHGFANGALVSVCKGQPIVSLFSPCKHLLSQLFGRANINSDAELSPLLLQYIARPQSAASLRQTLQAAQSNRLARYDFGPVGNLIFYETLAPPDYELSAISHPRVYLVTGSQDAVVDSGALKRLVSELGTKPRQVLEIKDYNHLDLIGGSQDNALKVNAPILHILDDRYLELDYYVEEGTKFGAEEIFFDTSHNRLNANDTSGVMIHAGAIPVKSGQHQGVRVVPVQPGAGGGFMAGQGHAHVGQEPEHGPVQLARAHSSQRSMSAPAGVLATSAAGSAALPGQAASTSQQQQPRPVEASREQAAEVAQQQSARIV